MAMHVGREMRRALRELRYEPVSRRIRCAKDGVPVLDTTDAYLVWEPRRVVPIYAVPEADFRVGLTPYDEAEPVVPDALPPVIGSDRFGLHVTPGQRLSLVVGGTTLEDAAFRPSDPDLGGRITVDWAPFDWTEEDQPVIGHPHDPFGRIDVLRSGRHVVVSLDGVVLADTRRARVLYETSLPPRWYIPRDDVRLDLLEPSDTRTVCAYKGYASYYAYPVAGDDGRSVAWTYVDPLHDAAEVKSMICFYSERSDLDIDGERLARPRTPWSRHHDSADGT
ncbi:MAG: DUF427 domain-containing protein [Nocardioidaceae bacterium]